MNKARVRGMGLIQACTHDSAANKENSRRNTKRLKFIIIRTSSFWFVRWCPIILFVKLKNTLDLPFFGIFATESVTAVRGFGYPGSSR
jgi:hypothetical protein